MTPETLRRIVELVQSGATLIGEPVPVHSVSMRNYPACDREMARLVAEIWGETKISKQGERRPGQWPRDLGTQRGRVAG